MDHTKVIFKKYPGVLESELTTNPLIPNKNKLLYIDTVENFDSFTNKYGFIDDKYFAIIYIRWDLVAKDFMGFGLNHKLFGDRFFECQFRGKEYISWWDAEYYYDDFNLFV